MQKGQFADHPEPHSVHSLRGTRDRRGGSPGTRKSSTRRQLGLLQIKKCGMERAPLRVRMFTVEETHRSIPAITSVFIRRVVQSRGSTPRGLNQGSIKWARS